METGEDGRPERVRGRERRWREEGGDDRDTERIGDGERRGHSV